MSALTSGAEHGLAGEGGAGLALLAALLLGLRHATDPDHLTAVATLVVSERAETEDRDAEGRRGGFRSGRSGLGTGLLWGLAWGGGHATTLVAVGLPLVLLGRSLPRLVHQGAELAVGVLIAGLAVRLLLRWRRGYFHLHPHRHGEVRHAHPHFHEPRPAEEHPHPHGHDHEHPETLGKNPLGAYGVGLVHGVGGSAGAGVLVAATLPDPTTRAVALVLFAAATAASMAAVSGLVGTLSSRAAPGRRLEAAIPTVGVASLLFGLWYALQATGFGP